MIVNIDKSFEKDVYKIKDKKIKGKIASCIEEIQEVNDITDVKAIKKLKGDNIYYRVRIQDYRLGLILEDEEVIMIRCLHRKDIYRFFPNK